MAPDIAILNDHLMMMGLMVTCAADHRSEHPSSVAIARTIRWTEKMPEILSNVHVSLSQASPL